MYYFIYDSFAQSQDYAKELARIENRLLDFGIKDKIVKISPLKSVRDAVAEAYKYKYNTIVTVGGDDLFLSTITYLVGYPIALGIIPLGKQTLIADILGMPSGSTACDSISARKLKEITVGRADERFFFSTCVLKNVDSIIVDSKYEVFVGQDSIITIINHLPKQHGFKPVPKKQGSLSILINPQKNGFLSKNKEKESFFFGSSIEIKKKKELAATIDNIPLNQSYSTISLYQHPIKCIVGKTSSFR